MMDFSNPSERHLFLGMAGQPVLRVMQRVLHPGDLAVDVGANVGFMTAYMAQLVGGKGNVYSFEPHPVVGKRLQSLASSNPLANIKVIAAAVSSEQGTATLHVSSRHSLSSLHDSWAPDTVVNRVNVPTVTLDSFLEEYQIQRVRLVKIDVEGHEAAVLQGFASSMAKGLADCIIFEVTPPLHRAFNKQTTQIMDAMQEQGYAIHGLLEHSTIPYSDFRRDLDILAPEYNVVAFKYGTECSQIVFSLY
ncbi:MAG: FkbM family methyltransferase [SAR202 cluster bacterium]|nr:FkbM family methyltransferase [SAR202 cluster bacterium]